MEEAWQEEERGPLVEAVAFMVDETASAAGEGVLLQYCDFEAGFGEASGS